ncbi:MAG: hypothetical protein MZW92_81395 [Comamonadaceae bacterium]|nr:hypothetical protein [Comamonadaceae bacterium]
MKSTLARSPLRSPARCRSLFHSNILFASASTSTVKPPVFTCETFELKPRACRSSCAVVRASSTPKAEAQNLENEVSETTWFESF